MLVRVPGHELCDRLFTCAGPISANCILRRKFETLRNGCASETAKLGLATENAVPVLKEREDDWEIGNEDCEKRFAKRPVSRCGDVTFDLVSISQGV